MVTAKSIHIGLNSVDKIAYDGRWDGRLSACENDVEIMRDIAISAGFETKRFLTKAATRYAILKEIRELAKVLVARDILLVTYSGHGGELPFLEGKDPSSGNDRTLCLYDGQLLLDELTEVWAHFRKDVRILVILDTCQSSTVTKVGSSRREKKKAPSEKLFEKRLPPEIGAKAYENPKQQYASIQAGIAKLPIGARVLQLSACQDWQIALAGEENSLFTRQLRNAWKKGDFKGDYQTFKNEIEKRLFLFGQNPNLSQIGNGKGFSGQTPFQINEYGSSNSKDSPAPIRIPQFQVADRIERFNRAPLSISSFTLS